MPDSRVQLSGGFEGIADRSPGASVVGAGDVRLGATASVVQIGVFRAWTGFAVKLPDARDEDELGTDETDVAFGAAFELSAGPWAALGGAGLGVWGNPLRFANQDDVPMVRVAGSWALPGSHPLGLQLGAALNADLATARNPGRTVIGGWVRLLKPVGRASAYLECNGGAGLTAAAPDGFAGVSIGISLPPAMPAAMPEAASVEEQASPPPSPEAAR